MTDQLIVLEVLGLPIAQGSMVAFIDKRSHRALMKPTNETALKLWRKKITGEATHAMHYHDQISGPLKVQAVFAFDRPNHHYGTGRNTHLLRDNAPRFPDNRGSKDLDKLLRAAFDALTDAGVWADDSQVVHAVARKLWAGESVHAPETPGMRIQVEPALITEGVLL